MNLNLFLCFITLCSVVLSQQQQKEITIAELNGEVSSAVNFDVKSTKIPEKIGTTLDLSLESISLENMTIFKDLNENWSLHYDVSFMNGVGIYEEILNVIDEKLVISENRSAKFIFASNCQQIQFSDDELKYECVSKIDDSLESEIEHQLFISTYN